MNKQEFLAMSLPYGLRANIQHLLNQVIDSTWYAREFEDKAVTLLFLLHPLSDLTKEIEHNGERFVPIRRIKESQWHLFFRGDITSPLEGLQFSELRKLIEWHFDLADFISKGEAIDVNTLPVNPYK